MEVDWFENVGTAEEIVPFDADNDASMFEGERCGICMDIIIDRGVLDCCQHWFCFACIDNWSTITNLCPLCQNEFQLITCVPVYDTIGGNTEEDSVPRDDEWSVEGKNNSLSFPSYYIDENAVTCLDGDDCKLRSGSVTLEESLTFDTSIACDSCDTWHHAFCVGFDTESTSVESWLCPRCLLDEERKLAASATELGQNQYHSGIAENHSTADRFSGKVSISVADDGETAVVVSMVDQKHLVEEPNEKSLTTDCLGFSKEDDLKQSRSTTPETSSDTPLALSIQKITSDVLSSEAGDIGLPVSSDMVLCSTFTNHKLKSNFEDKIMVDELNVSSIKCPQSIKKSTSEEDASQTPDEGSVVAGSVGENLKSIPVGADEREHCSLPLESCHVSADESKHGILVALGGKRRRKKGESAHASDRKRIKLAAEGLSRKVQAEKSAEGPSVVGLPDSDAFNRSHEAGHDRIRSRDEREQVESAVEEDVDIMSIVQGTESKILNPANKLSERRRDIVGPRVKKIVRRPVENTESSDMVQNLRKEIREAIRDKSSKDVGKSLFDPKLLAAFRAAVAVPGAEPVNKVPASVVKAKRPILQKGSTRENLTKKIYATASGKRKQSWYRDCQVEFWKHRCPKTTKFEKIETLKSVLGLLKWDPEAAEAKKNLKAEASSSILSRIYLADASVFPRKDDIKPISSLETSSTRVSTKTEDTKADKTAKAPSLNSAPLKSNTSSLDNKKNKSTSSGMKTGALSNKGKIDKPDDIKTDKRLWALQVLARKTASSSTTPGHQKQEGDPVLKGNCPLLAQLPVDMRPKLEACRHNKITNAVRQAQLNRLAENLLRLTNISPIRKTAATELAVADAINIEREIANRSQSKVVYINLCSQELRRRQSTDSQNPVEDPNPSTLLTVSTKEEPSNSPPALDPEVEKALKLAGLLDDSPPSSPNHGADNFGDNDDEEAKDKEPDNVLEMDSHPELDIYGEFEYDIEDEDYIGASAIKESNLQTEEGESKMKVVFSTFIPDKQETAFDSKTLERTADELESSYTSQSDCKSAIKADSEEPLSLPPDSTTEGVEEPTPTECEELYGPDKEPLFASISFSNLALPPVVKPSDLESEKQDHRNSDAKANNNAQPKEHENDPHINADKQQKVQAYIKEHIRPLCKSGIISVEQYRWAVGKTTDKVMKHHSKAKNANFLIKEGEKVRKLAEQYVEAAKLKDKDK